MTIVFSIAAIMLSIIIGYILYIKTNAGDAVSSITSSPILKKILKWFIVIILLFIGYQILAFVAGFIPWDKFSEHLPNLPNLPNLPDFSFNFENSFFTTWDWTSFSWIQNYLGGAGNVIIWTLVVLAIFWTITSLFQRKIEYGMSGWLFFLVLLAAFIFAITNANKAPETKVEKSSFVNANRFSRAHNGEVSIVTMSVAQTVRVRIHTTSPRIHGTGKAFWACAEVTKPSAYSESVNFEIDPRTNNTPVNNISLTKKSRDLLIEDKIMEIEVTFTQTLGTPNQSPCKH